MAVLSPLSAATHAAAYWVAKLASEAAVATPAGRFAGKYLVFFAHEAMLFNLFKNAAWLNFV
jgi:hypothetical protein